MSDNGRPEQTVDGGAADARPACVALVPVAQPTEWTGRPASRPRGPPRPLSPNCSQPPSRPRKPAACAGPPLPTRRPLTAPAGSGPRRRHPDPANHLNRDLARRLSGDGCEPSPGCNPGDGTSGEGARRRDLGMRDFRLRAIQRHGFGAAQAPTAPARTTGSNWFQAQPPRLFRASRRETAGAATARRAAARSAMPDRKSTSASNVSRKKVELPNCGSNTNSAAAPPNTSSDSRWSVRYFAPGARP